MLTIEKKSLRVGKYVDANHVDSLVRTYKQERWKYNSERMGKDDSLNVYYTVNELQEFLQKSQEAGADGIRIHFGVYPDNFAEKPEKAGMQTVVMVATRRHETESGIMEKNVYVSTEKGSKILAYNMGGTPTPLGRNGDDEWGGMGTTLVDLGNKGMKVV
jgi:hypothetical protein